MTSLKSRSRKSYTKEGSSKMTSLLETFSRSAYQESCRALKKQSSICCTIKCLRSLLIIRIRHRLLELGLKQRGGMMRLELSKEIMLSLSVLEGCIEWLLRNLELTIRTLVMHHRLVDLKGLLLKTRYL